MTRLVPVNGTLVRNARTAAGMTQAALADAAGLSRQYVSEIERGHVAEVTQDTRAALSSALARDGDEGPALGQAEPRRRRVRGRPQRVLS